MSDAVRVEVLAEERTRTLRRAVLRPDLPPDAPLPGDELSGGVHLAAVDGDGAVLGTCFVYPDPCPWLPERADAWRLRQMATADGHRGRGIGGAVVQAGIEYATAQGARLLWCNAREPAVPFYQRHGFAIQGAVFTNERHPIPHQRMWRELSPQTRASND
ncbi:MAG: N-acetyltransferase [Pseudonocardiales bacterium]|nr:MAG: N-acetyltransferase [Pseudonocardiales bacterium]